MLPMSAMAASAGDKHLHKSIMSLTPKAAAAYWNQAVKDLSMLLYLHERNPTASCQEMRVMVNELLRWSCAVYMFNPTVLQVSQGLVPDLVHDAYSQAVQNQQ